MSFYEDSLLYVLRSIDRSLKCIANAVENYMQHRSENDDSKQ